MTAIQRRRLTRARHRQMRPAPAMFLFDPLSEIDEDWKNANSRPAFLEYMPLPKVERITPPWWMGRFVD